MNLSHRLTSITYYKVTLKNLESIIHLLDSVVDSTIATTKPNFFHQSITHQSTEENFQNSSSQKFSSIIC